MHRYLVGALSSIWIATFASTAWGTLTDAEQAQLRGYYASANLSSATSVRALLARPDLDLTEAREVVASATREVAFDEAHEKFFHELLFGAASESSRSDIAPAVVGGLLERSAKIISAPRIPLPRALELFRIHQFIEHDIASVSSPPVLRNDAIEACIQLYREHLADPHWQGDPDPATLAARTQAELALIAFAQKTVPLPDLASWIRPAGIERNIFQSSSILPVGLTKAPLEIQQKIESLIHAMKFSRETTLLWFARPRPVQVHPPGEVIEIPVNFTSTKMRSDRFPTNVQSINISETLSEIAFRLGRTHVRNVCKQNATLEKALSRLHASSPHIFPTLKEQSLDGTISRYDIAGYQINLMLADFDLALASALAHFVSESDRTAVEQFLLALAMLSINAQGSFQDSLLLSSYANNNQVSIKNIKGLPQAITEFTIRGETYAFVRSPEGTITSILRNQKPITLKSIPQAKIGATASNTWNVKSLSFFRVFGKPELGTDGDRIVVRSSSTSSGRDAVGLRAPSPDTECIVTVHASSAFTIIARASSGTTNYAGAAIRIDPQKGIASITALDGAGGSFPLVYATAIEKSASGVYPLRIQLDAKRIRVNIHQDTLSTELRDFLVGGGGDVAFAAEPGSEILLENLKIQPLSTKLTK